jgi:hypothetical protein
LQIWGEDDIEKVLGEYCADFFLSVFLIYENNIFYFLKIIFNISTSKRFKNIKK